MVASESKSGTLEDFLADSKTLIGAQAPDVPQGVTVADWSAIQKFCSAIGDVNPLYNDAAGGVGTLFNTMIAPPAFILSARTPDSGAAYEQKQYGLRRLSIRASAEWNDVIRLGERLVTDLNVTDVRHGNKLGDRDTVEVISTATYRTVFGGVLAKASGTVAMVPYSLGEPLIDDRDIYQYSDEEIRKLEADLDSIPPRRGEVPLYWSEVKVGDKLPTLVKGPLYYTEIASWKTAEAKPTTPAVGIVAHRQLIDKPGRITVNPSNNWPYFDIEQAYGDILAVQSLGFRMPVSRGLMRFALAGQVLTDWMGDLGFLRSMTLELPNHFLYEDTMWVTGEVINKSQERVDSADYFAVEVRLSGHNQLGQTLVEGKAVIYLPEKGFLVGLPIGNPWW